MERIEYKWGELKWTATSPTNYMPVGTNVQFRAVPCPDVAWPNGKPVWGGAAGYAASEAEAIFKAPGFYDITAECGNIVTAKMCAVEIDLDVDANCNGKIGENDEGLEEYPGGIVCVGTNSLPRIELKLKPEGLDGSVTLEGTSGGDKIKLWEDSERIKPVELGTKWTQATMPTALYVEGIKPSDTARDVGLVLKYIDSEFSCEDKIKLAVVRVEIQINNTPEKYDDIVCRYSVNPSGRPIIPCRIRLVAPESLNQPVVLSSSHVRFPNINNVTKEILLDCNGTWVSFEVSGQLESKSKNDAQIKASFGGSNGKMCASESLTVLWVSNINIKTAQDADFSIENTCELKPNPAKLGM